MQKVLSDIILNKVKDPRIPLLTSVTGVKMSSDLTHANVDISVFGDEHQKDECLKAIEHAKGFIRTEMCKKINLRVAPELHFALDNTLDEAARMDALIDSTIARDKELRDKSGSADGE